MTVENSRDPRLSEDMASQVAVYAQTNVLVGLHGAGILVIWVCLCVVFLPLNVIFVVMCKRELHYLRLHFQV